MEVITEFYDKIVYYDLDGYILGEERILNTIHPHSYHTLKGQQDQEIDYNGLKYKIGELSIDYSHRPFGTVQITHIKLSPK